MKAKAMFFPIIMAKTMLSPLHSKFPHDRTRCRLRAFSVLVSFSVFSHLRLAASSHLWALQLLVGSSGSTIPSFKFVF